MKKKVLIFSLAYFPKHVGGAEVAIQKITDRIPDVEFHLIANRFDSTLPKEERIGNVTVHRIGISAKNPSMGDLKKWPLKINKPLFQFLAAWHACLLHRKYHFDGAWAMMAHSCGVPVALFNLVFPKVPYVLTLQEGDPPEYVERTLRSVWPLFSRAFTHATIVQAISTFLGKWARRRGFTGPLEIIPNAVEAQRFAREYSPREITEVKKNIGKNDGEIWLIHTGRFVHKNALDDVVRSLRFLPTHVHFFLIGEGPDRSLYERIAREAGDENRIHFHPYVHVDEIPLFLRACDIFIRPSRSEGMGNSFVEAMAAGLPVIATQEGGLADFIFDEVKNPDQETTGWAVDKDSPEQIAAAVTHIVTHPEQVREVTRTARDMVFAKYDWDLIAKDMRERVFKNLFAK